MMMTMLMMMVMAVKIVMMSKQVMTCFPCNRVSKPSRRDDLRHLSIRMLLFVVLADVQRARFATPVNQNASLRGL
eukprot:3956882-Karenia_brevis.AAC.1